MEGYSNNPQEFKKLIQELCQGKKSKVLKEGIIFIIVGVIFIFT